MSFPALKADETIAGGLIDSYVAGYNQKKLAESEGVKVGTVFDHQFAYGFVTGAAMDKTLITNCLRRALSTMESEITDIIKNDMEALPVSIYAIKKHFLFWTIKGQVSRFFTLH